MLQKTLFRIATLMLVVVFTFVTGCKNVDSKNNTSPAPTTFGLVTLTAPFLSLALFGSLEESWKVVYCMRSTLQH
jgi:hypothetical protein